MVFLGIENLVGRNPGFFNITDRDSTQRDKY